MQEIWMVQNLACSFWGSPPMLLGGVSKLMLCGSRPLNMVLCSVPMERRGIHVELGRHHQLAVIYQMVSTGLLWL